MGLPVVGPVDSEAAGARAFYVDIVERMAVVIDRQVRVGWCFGCGRTCDARVCVVEKIEGGSKRASVSVRVTVVIHRQMRVGWASRVLVSCGGRRDAASACDREIPAYAQCV